MWGDFQILPPTSWFDSMENQGILFLNSYFTCDIGKRSPQKKNHKKIWMEFSCKLLNEVSNRNPKIKWFVWGSEAKKLVTKCKVKGSIFIVTIQVYFLGKRLASSILIGLVMMIK